MTDIRVFQCYAEGREGRWEALCLDLDIAVQGESFAQVFRDLDAAIRNYLDYVAGLPEADRHRLLNRKAPLWLRLTFLWHALCLRAKPGDEGTAPLQRAEFLLPAAA